MMETAGTSPHSEPIGNPVDPGLRAQDHAGDADRVSRLPDPQPVPAPWWARVIPFFLSAFFFLSALFVVFAPLPLLLQRFRIGRLWGWLAILTNAAIVGFAGGRLSLAIYGVFVATLALIMGEGVQARRSLETTVVVTLLAMALCGAAVLGWYAHIHHTNPLVEIRQQLSATVDYLTQSASEGKVLAPEDVDEWKQNLILEFPSAVVVFALILVWANLATLLRVNPGGIREKMGLDAGFLRNWKAPEWLVWPSIAAGAFLLFDVGRISHISLNVFRVLMAVYAIQGLCILSFFFEVWKLRGPLRGIAYLLVIFVMMPLLLSLGFFDLWFDFRSKFRQV